MAALGAWKQSLRLTKRPRSLVFSMIFWKWNRMTLAVAGVLLDWSRFMQNNVISGADDNLSKFIEENPEYKK